MMQFTQAEKKVFYMLIRLICYFGILVGVAVGIWFGAQHMGRQLFYEGGVVENTQWIVLIVAAIGFGVMAWRQKGYCELLLVLMSLCLLGVFREQDAVLDKILPVISWRIGYLFLIVAIINGFRKRAVFIKQITTFLQIPAFHLMFCSMVMIIPFAQCIGHKPLISKVLRLRDDAYMKAVRRMIEESGELMGYVLILLAGIELFLNIRSASKK